MKPIALLCAATLTLAAAPAAADSADDTTAIRRFALLASSNNGGPNRVRLHFADSDAESMGRVLETLGGVHEGDLILAREVTRAGLERAFADLKARLGGESRTRVRREVFVYYSGHSDDDGLLLGGERVSYRELRQWIDGLGADVRIAILDSCDSGSLIRLKGGVHRAPFLSDVSTKARGHAFLTASSADEAAQESDRVGASFFTHFLLSGLRGAADANHDRRVTLNEAYQFAYNETLQRTETSRAGAQHPSYDIQLAGTGDLVMTDLHASSSRLVLARELAGRIYVRDSAGRLIVELRKDPTYPVELGLESGKYHVVVDHDGRILEGTFELANGGRVDVVAANLTPVAPMVATRRGGEPSPPELGPAAPLQGQAPIRYRHVGFDLVLAPGYRLSGDTGEPVEHTFVLGVLGHSEHVRGVQLSAAGNISRDGVVGAQLGGMLALSYGPVKGVQMASYNLAVGGLYGAQLGWVANVAHGPVRGVQASFVNVAAGPVRGAQVGLANVEKGDFNGAQVGLVNIGSPARESHAAQVGLANLSFGSGENLGSKIGLLNAASKQRGAEVGLLNIADEMSGAQIGLLNLARRQTGVRVGLVNVADEVDGVQIGLVNFARKNDGASIALLPIVLDGDNRVTVTWNSTTALNLGFKLGTRRFYAVGAVGLTSDRDLAGNREYSSTFGLGVHLVPRGGRFLLDLDATNSEFDTLSNSHHLQRQVSSLRLQAGFAIARHLMVFGGPTLNVQEAHGNDDQAPRSVGWAEHVWHSGTHTVRMYPGLTAGLEL